MPVRRRGDDDDVDVLALQQPAEVGVLRLVVGLADPLNVTLGDLADG